MNPSTQKKSNPNKAKTINVEIIPVKNIDLHSISTEFQKKQKQIFVERFNSDKFTSLEKSWMTNESVYIVIARNINKTIIGGFRFHVNNDRFALPVERACGPFDNKVYNLIDSLSTEGCAEICALWISREGMVLGLEAIDLLRAAINVCSKNNIENVLSLVGPTTITYVEYFGAKIYDNLGSDGAFAYPSKEYKFFISNVKVSEVFDKVSKKERQILRSLHNQTEYTLIKKHESRVTKINYLLNLK